MPQKKPVRKKRVQPAKGKAKKVKSKPARPSKRVVKQFRKERVARVPTKKKKPAKPAPPAQTVAMPLADLSGAGSITEEFTQLLKTHGNLFNLAELERLAAIPRDTLRHIKSAYRISTFPRVRAVIEALKPVVANLVAIGQKL